MPVRSGQLKEAGDDDQALMCVQERAGPRVCMCVYVFFFRPLVVS